MQRVILILTLALSLTILTAACKRPIAEPDGERSKTSDAVPVASHADAASHPSAADVSPPAPEQLMHRTADFYKGLPGFQVDLSRAMHVEAQGQVENRNEQGSLSVQRPNRLAWHITSAGQGIDAVSDGAHLTIYLPERKKYTEEKAPASFQDLVNHPLFSGAVGDGVFFLKLLADDPYQAMMQGVKSVSYAGKETVNGVEAWHLKLVEEKLDWDLWIAATGQPAVVRVTHDLAKMLAAEGMGGPGAKFTVTQDFTKWRPGVPLAADAFAFKPADGARKVDSFEESAAAALVGKPAPEINAKLLDGGDFSLAGQRKQVVMLDFWATWCGPCVTELPILADVAAQYRDKGVRFFAVNQAESAEDIRSFLDDKKLDLQVVLDAEQAAAQAYLVEGIPQLVLVGKDGTVQAVHVGYRPDIADRLKEQLDSLLAGKSLADNAEAEDAQAAASPGSEENGDLERASSEAKAKQHDEHSGL